MLQKEGANTGGVMENRQLTELPINGRDYARFSLLMPGAIAQSNFISNLAFNGRHTVHNQFSIDGVDATRVRSALHVERVRTRSEMLTGSLDTIAEFRVQTYIIGGYGGPGSENYFYQTTGVHEDAKIRRFIPHNIVDTKASRILWYRPDEYVYRKAAESAAAILKAGGKVCVGGHGPVSRS